jgi:acetolactate synthase small subunit
MNNQNIISLVPLLEENKSIETLQAIESGNFNIYEVSEKGNNLFSLAFYYKEFSVADKLLEFNKDNNQLFLLEIDKKLSEFLFESLMYNSDTFFERLTEYKNFINRNNIVLHVDFNEIINTLAYYDTSIFNKLENIELLKFFLKDSINDIKNLDQVDTIKNIASLKCPNLLKMYYEICEFDKLPIQEHPSFKLLKDVATHPTKYYDLYVISKDPDRENLEYNIEKQSILKIKNEFEKIERVKDFSKYFKKGRDFLPDIFKLHYIPYFDRLLTSPGMEVDRIHSAIHSLNESVLVENQEKFLNYYLTNWPISYFAHKAKNHENIMSDDQKAELNKILTQYSLSNIFIHKDKDIDQIIKLINESINEIKVQFNLEDNEIGNNELSLIFNDINKQKEQTLGYFSDSNKSINFSNGSSNEENISIFIHEYTHYLQYQDKTLIHKLEPLGQLSKEWVDYQIKDFSENLFNYLAIDYYKDINNNQKENWLLFIESAIEKCQDGESLFNFIKKESSYLFKEEDYKFFKDYNFANAIKIVDIYYETQKNKDHSYEYYLWDNYEKNKLLISNGKKKNHREYWNSPLEIHARLNQDLYEERKNKTYSSINPAKLEQMKAMIQSFNEMFIYKVKDKKLKL